MIFIKLGEVLIRLFGFRKFRISGGYNRFLPLGSSCLKQGGRENIVLQVPLKILEPHNEKIMLVFGTRPEAMDRIYQMGEWVIENLGNFGEREAIRKNVQSHKSLRRRQSLYSYQFA